VDKIDGWRKDRRHNFGARVVAEPPGDKIRQLISRTISPTSASSLKVYQREGDCGMTAVNAHTGSSSPTVGEEARFKAFEPPVKHSQRFAGTAKYGFRIALFGPSRFARRALDDNALLRYAARSNRGRP
jgi:hypothetical protein